MSLRVLHLPTAVGGNSWRLSRGERSLGLESSVLVTEATRFSYPHDLNLRLDETKTRIGKFLKLSTAFMSLRNKYDVFHFNYGSSLIHSQQLGLNLLEVPYYPKKAKLFATYNGCDARQKFPTRKRTQIAPCHYEHCLAPCDTGQLDQFRQRSIAKMAAYADHIWSLNPDLMYFLPKEKASFLPYALNMDDIPYLPKQYGKALKVVHAPTHRQIKGSSFIIDAVKRLQTEFPGRVELQLIENLPHDQAMRAYEQSDLVVDQLLIGWYGGLAIEVMAMGKPVIARIADEDLQFIPDAMAKEVKEAVIHADPTSIYSVLRHCLEDPEFLKTRQEAGTAYVRKWHSAKYVAGIVKEKYESA